jgi:hypothetical protein
VSGAYFAIFWNHSGGIAAPAHAIKSYFQPDDRDYLSNLYRDQENENLRATFATSPIIGIGFGKPMEVVNGMIILTSIWSFQLYIPHNNMLWLWERMGIIGFAAFWAVMGATILVVVACVGLGMRWLPVLVAEAEAERRIRTLGADQRQQPDWLAGAPQQLIQESAEFLVLALLMLSTLAALVALGTVDQGLVSYRLMAYAGMLAGTVSAAWALYRKRFALLPKPLASEVIAAENAHAVQQRRVRFVSIK